jgi:hypothetical protein
MLNGIKATLFRLCEMSWQARTELKSWFKQSRTFSTFAMSAFANPSLLVASATNERGTVCYCPVEKCFLVSSYCVKPEATEREAQLAGDHIDAMLEREAQRAGVSKIMIVLPMDCPAPEGEWEHVRVYQRKVSQAVATGGIDISAQSQATRYLN